MSSTAVPDNDQPRSLPVVKPTGRTESLSLDVPAYFHESLRELADFMSRTSELHGKFHAGDIRAYVPAELLDTSLPLEDLIASCLPRSNKLLESASVGGLFYPLPVAFDPKNAVGPYLATLDTDKKGAPYRFLEMSGLIATQAFGENEPSMLEYLIKNMPSITTRPSHSEHQTELSLRIKSEGLPSVAPIGTPRFFVVNTGAEAVENAIKAALLHRVMTANLKDTKEFVIVSFKGGFHGRTLGCLGVTQRKRAREGFPTFDWPAVNFPHADIKKPDDTKQREYRSLKELWEIFVGRNFASQAPNQQIFEKQLRKIDAYLQKPNGSVLDFVKEERGQLDEEVKNRALRAAAVLVEPIQGEGGVRACTARFMQRLRMFTLIYDVPLIFDEVQTGWGMTGEMWAHYRFNLPAPPDAVTWAKKAQNGILFVSEELATFFQAEKRFNTTWEGDSVGMLRLLHNLPRLDLDQIARVGAMTKDMLEDLCFRYPELLGNLRGAGAMWAFDVVRQDLREALRDRAFRHGLLLLPTGEKGLRFYPRYDTPQHVFDDASRLLTLALEDLRHGRFSIRPMLGPAVRIGALECLPEAIKEIDITDENYSELEEDLQNVEIEAYGNGPLKVPIESLEQTLSFNKSIGVVLRDSVSKAIVAYAVGGPLEEFSDQGAQDDPHLDEGNVFFLHAMASLPAIKDRAEIENMMIDAVETRARKLGYAFISTSIEERIVDSRPGWQNGNRMQCFKNYLESGTDFCYVQTALQ